jgi:hypothetical protein
MFSRVSASAKTTPAAPTFGDEGDHRSLLSSQSRQNRKQEQDGLVAGIAIGAIAGVMIMAALVRTNNYWTRSSSFS